MEIEATEGAAEHPVDVERTLQVVDLVLQDARIPSRRLNDLPLSLFVQTLHAHVVRSRNDGRESRQAETAFEKLHLRRRLDMQRGIDDHMKRDWPPLALDELLVGETGKILLLVFDDRQLQRHSDLWRGQAHSGRVVHSLPHMFDKVLDLCAADFRGCEWPRRLAQTASPTMPIFSRMGLVHRHVDLYGVIQAAAAGLHGDCAALGLWAGLLLIDRAVAAATTAGDRAQQHADQEKAKQASKAAPFRAADPGGMLR